MRVRSQRKLFLLPLCGLLLVGCGGKRPTLEQELHLQELGFIYGEYTRAHITPGKGPTPPPNMEALKKFARSKPKLLEGRGIDPSDVDDLFVSPRDGQEYVLRPARAIGGTPGVPGKDRKVVIYEAEGKDGKRVVMYEETATEEIDEDEFRKLVPEAK